MSILTSTIFPVFILPDNVSITTEDKITKVKTPSGVFLLDNKNLVGDTLGKRRLRIKGSKVYPLRMAKHNIEQLIKHGNTRFIDSVGILGTYKKDTVVHLKYYKVSKVDKMDDGCIITFTSIYNPLLVSCNIAYGIKYVGFLITDIGYIPYEYSEVKKRDTWRKI